MENLEIKANEPLTFTQKVIGVIVNPVGTINDIAINPTFIKPLLFIILTGLIQSLLTLQSLEKFMLRELSMIPVPTGQTPEAFRGFTLAAVKVVSIVGGMLIPVINCLVGATILWLIGRVVKKVAFDKLFCITLFASIPKVFLGGYIDTAMAIFSNGLSFSRNSTSLAVLLPDNISSNFVFTFCNLVEVFTLWSLLLAGTGGAIIMKTIPRKIIIPLAFVWLILIMILAGMKSVR